MARDLSRRIRTPRPRAVIYTRVSRDKREGRSVAEQEAECRRDVERETWDLIATLSDNNVSASRYSKKERPDWIRLVNMVRAGEADCVAFWEMSRGTRNRREWADFAEAAEDAQLLIMVRGRVYDATDPHDMAYLDNLVSRGIEEVGETRDRILRAVAATGEAGKPFGGAGYGYRREYDPDSGALLRQVPNEEQAEVIREMAKRVLSGETILSVVKDLNQRGVPAPSGYIAGEINPRTGRVHRGWSQASLRRTLLRPAIMGKREWNGRIIEVGGWEPIISEADYWTLHAKLTAPERLLRRDSAAVWLMSGVAICDVCGGRVFRGKVGGGPSVYSCRGIYPGAPSRHVTRMVHLLDAHVETLLVAEFSRPDVLDAFREQGSDEGEIAEVRAAIARLEADKRMLYEDVAAGRVSRMLAAADERRIDRELAELQRRDRPMLIEPHAVALADPDPERVLQTWRSWPLQRQRSALRALTREIRVLRTGKIGRRVLKPSESVRIVWPWEEPSPPPPVRVRDEKPSSAGAP